MRYLRLGIAFLIIILLALLPMDDAGADNAWESVVNGNVSGNSVQFDYRGGTASYITSVSDGSTVTVTVDNTIANCIGSCTPIPDNWTVSINGQSFSGNTIEIATVSAVVSGQATISVSGIDAGFWGGWYGPIFTVSVSSPEPVVEPSPSPSPTATEIPSPAPSETSTPSPTPEPTFSPSPDPTSSPEPDPTPTPEPTPTPSQSPVPQNNVVNGSANENDELTLSAPIGKIFTSVVFASYGTPDGYSIGQCHAPSSVEKVAEVFLGKAIATIMAINDLFGDPCGGTYKSLAVSLAYSDDPQAPEPSPSPSPSPSSDTPTAVVTPQPIPPVEPSPSAEPSPSPSPPATLEPSPSPSPSPEPVVTPIPQPQQPQEPAPTIPEPTPEPSPTPSPDTSPTPDETPIPEPEPEPSPSEPEPTPAPEPEPEPEPEPVQTPEPTPEPEPEPTEPPTPIEEPSPEPPSESPSELLDDILADGDVSAEEVASIVDSVQADGKLTEAEKEIVAEALIAQFDGEPVTAAAIAEAGIDYGDLPPETPVETRLSESGEPIVITAEVADALELVANPAELVGAIFTDPAKALMALGNIGADMSTTEREESQTVVVASVIVGAIASLSIRRM